MAQASRAMRKKDFENVIIIGSGPAGFSAALYAARAGLSPLMLTGSSLGGAIAGSERVANWPGLQEISGENLIKRFKKQVLAQGARLESLVVKSIMKLSAGGFRVRCEKISFTTHAIILACGTTHRRLNIPGESEYWGRGVSVCATCDAPFYTNKTIAVIGGGPSGIKTSLSLAKYAQKVYLITRDAALPTHIQAAAREAVMTSPYIEIVPSVSVQTIHGDGHHVTGITLANTAATAVRSLSVDGVFLALGTKPNTDFVTKLISCDPEGYAICQTGSTATSVPGIFAAGDIVDKKYRQAITAAAMGCQAALDCEYYLTGKNQSTFI